MTFTMIDLFSGVGGLSLGFEAAGFEVLAGNDFDDEIVNAFEINHPSARTWRGPIQELDPMDMMDELGLAPGELDVLVGGPPCQGFSRNRARRHVRGEFVDDPRNYLFKEFLKFAEVFEPRAILIENVPDMLVKQGGAFEQEISERLDDMGYHYTSAKVLNAADYGVPQKRRRAFILAGRESKLELPQPTHSGGDQTDTLFPLKPWVTIWDAISDLPRLHHGEGTSPSPYGTEPATDFQRQMRGEQVNVEDHVAWAMSQAQDARLSCLGEGEGIEKLPEYLRPKSGYGSAYRRMSRHVPALTITTWMYHPGSGMYYHPTDHRTITLREGARLQSFPDWVKFTGGKTMRCRQVGNAVPPLLARAIAEKIREQLGAPAKNLHATHSL